MRMPAVFKNAGLLFVLLWLAFFSIEAQAAIDNAGVLDNVLNRYSAAASGWAGFITARATWLFWTLAVISMVWTFGFMALRKADIGEFYAEFIRFTIFTGFFWWLLTNGPNFATDIMSSLRTIAGSASGTGSTLLSAWESPLIKFRSRWAFLVLNPGVKACAEKLSENSVSMPSTFMASQKSWGQG